MSIRHGGSNSPVGNVVLGESVDATLAANLPADPATGNKHYISVAGSFESDASITPVGYAFTAGDSITWDGTNWIAADSGDDLLKTTNNLSDLSNATTARTNLDVDSKAEVDGKIDADVATHAGLTQTHGISAFGSTLVDDADATTARATLDVSSTSQVNSSAIKYAIALG